MNEKKNLASIAKKRSGRPKKTDESITQTKSNKNDFEEKAKKKVEELLGSIEMTPQEKKQVESKISKEELGGVQWLTEQVNLLTKENEKLKQEIKFTTLNKDRETNELKNKVKIFFNDIQTYFQKWGGSLVVRHKEFNQKMYNLFPFLND